MFEQGCDDAARGIARESFAACGAVPDFVHGRLSGLSHRYLLVGGLPAAVSAFVRDGVVDQVGTVQAEILRLCRRDISKCAPREGLSQTGLGGVDEMVIG